jgi:ribonuclease G
MSQKLIVSRIENCIWSALFEEDKMIELRCTKEDSAKQAKVGNVYIGKVKNIVANIGAAFVEIAEGIECYYSLSENPTPIFTQKIGKKPLCIGDELLVQVSKEALKTKVPTVTSKISLAGKYAVLTTGDTRVGVSSKIGNEERTRLLTATQTFISDAFGIIIRTNAKDVSLDVIENELKFLVNEYSKLVSNAKTRTVFSCMKEAPKDYVVEVRNLSKETLEEIVVEDEDIFEEIKTFLEENQPEDVGKLRIYKDSLLPLHKLYNIEKCISNALKEQVWLKSGAYLVIQPTEALTVIDVNSGKCISKKHDLDAIFKVNREAALECARQIRLRNISGIILIDFINMDDAEYMKRLLDVLERELSKDPVVTNLVDVTKLQLVEITRKKVRKPLHEAVRD